MTKTCLLWPKDAHNVTDEALQAVGSFCLLFELLALYSYGQLTENQDSEFCTEGTHGAEKDSNGLTQNILQLVPPLHSRQKDGMTFAEFSRETTKHYYGSSGLQPNR
ncbi:uncharacterized protein Fot_02122 [Forsythia ovata]|uniref:Uncharacterized protein n=1 Tax=Forsythia ovata TaxID=205694 RepID=A0ABD1X5Y0_9LAMI